MRESPGGPSTTGLVAATPARPELGAGRAARRGIVVRGGTSRRRSWVATLSPTGCPCAPPRRRTAGFSGPGGRAAERWSPVVPGPGWLWSRGGCGVVGRGRRDDRAGPCRQPGRARPCRRVGDHRCGRPGGGRGASVRSGVAASGVAGYGRCRGVPAVAGGASRLRAGGVDRSGRGDRCGGGVGGGRGRLFDQAFPARGVVGSGQRLSLIHISEPTRRTPISY